MKNLKDYIKESRSILADIDDQLESGDEALKSVIINWLKENVESIRENRLKLDFNTAPITVNYVGNVRFKNHITSLTNGVFQWGEVKGYFDCYNCESLESLEGAPKEVGEGFYCDCCKSLKSLKGSPKKIGKGFHCKSCTSLESLEGAPNVVKNSFDCSLCKSLKSLEGAPKYVGNLFDCSSCNSLESLEGAPKEVGGSFICVDCGKKFTEKDVKKVSKVKIRIYC